MKEGKKDDDVNDERNQNSLLVNFKNLNQNCNCLLPVGEVIF